MSPLVRPLRLAGAAAGLAVLAAGGVLPTLPAPDASAAPGDYCADDRGVTVVVDLGDLDPNAGVVVRCAEDAAGVSGLEALTAAGLTFTMPARFPGMICRLGGAGAQRPAPGEVLPVQGDPDYVETCVNAPLTRAYWSYWYADEGGRWTYSSTGPSSRTVIAGGFEGWSYSLNRSASAAPPPRVSPDNPNAPYEQPAPPSPEPEPEPTPAPNSGPEPSEPSPNPAPSPAPAPEQTPGAGPDAGPSSAGTPEPTEAAPSPQSPRPTPDRDRPTDKPAKPDKTDKRRPERPQAANRGADERAGTSSARSPDSGVRVTDDVDTSAAGSVGEAVDQSSGPPASTWWGLGAVAGLGLAAVGIQRRRRSGDRSP